MNDKFKYKICCKEKGIKKELHEIKIKKYYCTSSFLLQVNIGKYSLPFTISVILRFTYKLRRLIN